MTYAITIWADPVWSAVIAAVVVGVLATVWKGGRGAVAGWIAAIFGTRGVRATVTASADGEFPHVPTLTIHVQNRSLRQATLTALDLVTRRAWSLPDPNRGCIPAPVVRFLPPDTRFVKVSPEPGSMASFPLATVVPARGVTTVSLRVLTDQGHRQELWIEA